MTKHTRQQITENQVTENHVSKGKHFESDLLKTDVVETEAYNTQLCKQWLLETVIKHNFCPYAKLPYDKGQVHFVEYQGQSDIQLIEALAGLCMLLQDQPSIETALLICANPTYLADFYDYLAVLDVANDLLHHPKSLALRLSDAFQNNIESLPKTWEDVFQIASFHPHYVFEGSGEADRDNYTNRSPMPIFHLLRNDSIEKVKMTDDKADKIIQRNCDHLQTMSADAFKTIQKLAHSIHPARHNEL